MLHNSVRSLRCLFVTICIYGQESQHVPKGMAQRRLEIEVQFPGYFFINRLQKKYFKIEVNKQKQFWSHKLFANINKSLFEVRSESTKDDLNVLLTHGLTINIKMTPIPGIFQ